MKKGMILSGTIAEVDFPNKSAVYIEETDDKGKKSVVKVTVKGGIKGQKISFAVKKARRDKCQGRLLEVLEKSPLETGEPACPKSGICGGCSYQSVPYETQLEIKKEQVIKLIDAVYDKCPENGAGFVKDYIYDGILGSPDIYGYRNKMEFSFGDEVKDGPLTLGLHKKGSFHDIINADCCKLVHKDFTDILTCVRDYCAGKGIQHYNKKNHEGILRHLLVRRSATTGEVMVALVVSSQKEYDWSELVESLKKLEIEGTLSGVLLITNDSLGDVVKSDRTDILYGKDWFMEEILGLKFKITPFSFFQTNTRGAEVLYSRARDYILGNDITSADSAAELVEKVGTDNTESVLDNKIQAVDLHDKTVFDLYSGTGTIAQIIAPVAKKVIGVEIVEEAVEAARENAALNGLTNCEFIAGDVLKVLDDIEEKPDFIILDPPRDGINPKALKKIIDYGVENIVYISCKPTSLARDLEMLEQSGYHLMRMSNVDMFAWAGHVETCVLLVRECPV